MSTKVGSSFITLFFPSSTEKRQDLFMPTPRPSAESQTGSSSLEYDIAKAKKGQPNRSTETFFTRASPKREESTIARTAYPEELPFVTELQQSYPHFQNSQKTFPMPISIQLQTRKDSHRSFLQLRLRHFLMSLLIKAPRALIPFNGNADFGLLFPGSR